VDKYKHKEGKTIFIIVGLFCASQETEGQKTNNGIQYRLQLLYANGKWNYILFLKVLRIVFM
jgi:hypothetical protein